jgi:hypothetical protein
MYIATLFALLPLLVSAAPAALVARDDDGPGLRATLSLKSKDGVCLAAPQYSLSRLDGAKEAIVPYLADCKTSFFPSTKYPDMDWLKKPAEWLVPAEEQGEGMIRLDQSPHFCLALKGDKVFNGAEVQLTEGCDKLPKDSKEWYRLKTGQYMLHGSYYCLDAKDESQKKPTKKGGLDLVDLHLWQCWPDSKQQSKFINLPDAYRLVVLADRQPLLRRR